MAKQNLDLNLQKSSSANNAVFSLKLEHSEWLREKHKSGNICESSDLTMAIIQSS